MTPLEIDSGTTAWLLTSSSAGAAHDARTCALLRRHGPREERSQHDDDELRGAGLDLCHLGSLGLLAAFGDDIGYGLLGDPTQYLGLKDLMGGPPSRASLPPMAFVAFQAVFAIITVALIWGDRRPRQVQHLDDLHRIWATLVYFPIAHWVFDSQP